MNSKPAAMIMAAGYGKRMRPLTASRPKPLIQVAGKPLIDHVLNRLKNASIGAVVINVHYLADSLEAHLEGLDWQGSLTISDEREALLETGGGLVKALPHITSDPFYCLNSDNIWLDGPNSVFDVLLHGWDNSKMDALLLVVPHQRAHNYRGPGDFHMDARGRLTRRTAGRVAPYIFTGIQLLSKALITNPPAAKFSTNVFWDRAMAQGRLYGLVHEGLWCDVGNPQAIEPTADLLLNG